ncbi:hypothetical protein AVEN_80166-1, partial [Araneus ventricosus]
MTFDAAGCIANQCHPWMDRMQEIAVIITRILVEDDAHGLILQFARIYAKYNTYIFRRKQEVAEFEPAILSASVTYGPEALDQP